MCDEKELKLRFSVKEQIAYFDTLPPLSKISSYDGSCSYSLLISLVFGNISLLKSIFLNMQIHLHTEQLQVKYISFIPSIPHSLINRNFVTPKNVSDTLMVAGALKVNREEPGSCLHRALDILRDTQRRAENDNTML